MTPFGWIGDRLLCEGDDGRVYLRGRGHVTAFTRACYAHLPRLTDDGAVEGYGCKRWEDRGVAWREAFPLAAGAALLLWCVITALVWSGLTLAGAP